MAEKVCLSAVLDGIGSTDTMRKFVRRMCFAGTASSFRLFGTPIIAEYFPGQSIDGAWMSKYRPSVVSMRNGANGQASSHTLR